MCHPHSSPRPSPWRLAARGARLWLLLSLVSLLTACQPPALPDWWPSLLGGATPTPTSAPPTAELHLATWASAEPIDDYFRQRITAYQQTTSGVQVELQVLPNYATRLRAALDGPRPPDVIRLNAFALPTLVAEGLVAPLPAAVAGRTQLSPLLQTMSEVNGQLYCLPQEINTLALIYNPALFDAAGLAYPTADWNWETLRTNAEALTDATAGRYGLILPADFSRWLPFLYQAGGTVTDTAYTTMTINSPAATTALDFYTGLVLEGMAATPPTVGDSWAGAAFAAGHAAMIIEGNWIIGYLAEEAPTLTYGVAPLPVGPAGQATVAFVSCYALSARTTNAAAAGQLIEFLTSEESQQLWMPLTASLPVSAPLQATWSTRYPTQQAFLQGLGHAYPWRFAANFQPVVDQINSDLQRIYGGFILADSLLSAAETKGNELLQGE